MTSELIEKLKSSESNDLSKRVLFEFYNHEPLIVNILLTKTNNGLKTRANINVESSLDNPAELEWFANYLRAVFQKDPAKKSVIIKILKITIPILIVYYILKKIDEKLA
jgi:hypothetical protein